MNKNEIKALISKECIYQHKDGDFYIIIDTWKKRLSNGKKVRMIEYVNSDYREAEPFVRTESHFLNSFKLVN